MTLKHEPHPSSSSSKMLPIPLSIHPRMPPPVKRMSTKTKSPRMQVSPSFLIFSGSNIKWKTSAGYPTPVLPHYIYFLLSSNQPLAMPNVKMTRAFFRTNFISHQSKRNGALRILVRQPSFFSSFSSLPLLPFPFLSGFSSLPLESFSSSFLLYSRE